MNENTSEMSDVLSHIYSRYPSNKHKIIPIPESEKDLEDGVLIFGFEMILEFYLEGLCHATKLYKILNKIYDDDYKKKIKNQDYDDIILKDVGLDSLKIPELWVNSIGFALRIDEEDFDTYLFNIKNNQDNDTEYLFKGHYCKIITKYDPLDKPYFEYKNISKPYHCLINNDFDESNKNELNKIFAIIKINKKIYKISFISLDL